jgi:hypothetical protein
MNASKECFDIIEVFINVYDIYIFKIRLINSDTLSLSKFEFVSKTKYITVSGYAIHVYDNIN